MKHITLNIGTERRGDGLPLTQRERVEGMKQIEKATLEIFDGVTISSTWGGWRDPRGEIVTEEGLQIEVLTDSPTARADALTLAQRAKAALFQESVLVRVEDVDAVFV